MKPRKGSGMFDAAVSSALVDRIWARLPGLSAIYLYGSQAGGSVHPESDVDLALLLPPDFKVPISTLAELSGDLESLAGCPVEISVLDRRRSIVHCKEVVTRGRLIYSADRAAVEAFEMQTLSEYAQFCEDRLPVVEEYRAG
jgi:predicted nucleotidyltransferase